MAEKWPKIAQKLPEIAQKLPKIAQMAQKLPKMAQKLAPAEKTGRDISAGSANFCISALGVVIVIVIVLVGLWQEKLFQILQTKPFSLP